MPNPDNRPPDIIIATPPTMSDVPKVKPTGFTIVSPHLEAINFLQHIDKMVHSKRAQTIHATSRKRHKFKKLQEDLIEWRKTPTSHVKDMKAAHKEWRVPGIRELNDNSGRYMFSRAITTSAVLTQTQIQTTRDTTGGTTVGTTVTATPAKSDTARAHTIPPAQAPTILNPVSDTTRKPVRNLFFTLDNENKMQINWATRARIRQMTQQQ
jgi:hypothetical protein